MPKTVSERNLTIAELRKLLEEQRASRELSTLENMTLDYASKMDKVGDADKAREAVNRLMEEYKLPEEYAVQLVNIMPKVPGEVRLVLSPLNRIFSDEELKGILNLLSSISK